MNEPLKFVEITKLNDDLLLSWLDLYEVSFPPEEKMLVSSFLKFLKEKAKGQWESSYMTAVLDDAGRFVGLLRYDLDYDARVAYLWYIAVHPDARNRGVGSVCYKEILHRANEAGMRAMIFEVEDPETISDVHLRECAKRRINFYKRLGATILRGIHYTQSVGPHQPETPMLIMAHPIQPITPQEVFDIARLLFGDHMTQVGELALE